MCALSWASRHIRWKTTLKVVCIFMYQSVLTYPCEKKFSCWRKLKVWKILKLWLCSSKIIFIYKKLFLVNNISTILKTNTLFFCLNKLLLISSVTTITGLTTCSLESQKNNVILYQYSTECFVKVFYRTHITVRFCACLRYSLFVAAFTVHKYHRYYAYI